jgi:hypothetical protein
MDLTFNLLSPSGSPASERMKRDLPNLQISAWEMSGADATTPVAERSSVPEYRVGETEKEILQRLRFCWDDPNHVSCRFSRFLGCRIDNEDLVPLPTRVLRICDGNKVSLVESSGERGCYAILSYCWAPEVSLRLV